MNLAAIPVIMYHSVKYKRKDSWIHKHLSLTLDEFTRHLQLLKILALKPFFLDDLEMHMNGTRRLPLRSVILTFDDGYADNWLFVYPLLAKHKMRATIFVNPDFIKKDDYSVRPNLFDYWNGKITLSELNNYDGFLSWEEMRIMEKSGFIDIQSHTMTHTQYPVSDEIVDFVNPETKIDWLYWNLFPDDKPNFLTAHTYKIPFGYPIYKAQKGNIARKYTEDGTLADTLTRYVKNSGGIDFFSRPDWKKELSRLSNQVKAECSDIYTLESEQEYQARLEYELVESKRIIEENLTKKVNHLCWPFGGWDEYTLAAAVDKGYHTSTARGDRNIFGKTKYHNVERIAMDNPKYQNFLIYPYGLYKIFKYKI